MTNEITKKDTVGLLSSLAFLVMIGLVLWLFVPWQPRVPKDLLPTKEPMVYLVTLIDGEVGATLGPIENYTTCLIVRAIDNVIVEERQERAQTDESLAHIKDIRVENVCMITKYRPQVK